MVRSVLSKILFYVLLSSYSVLYKYVMIKSSLDNYSSGSGFMGMYKTNSSESVNYINIFVLSMVSVFLIDFLLNVVVFYISKVKYKDLFIKISNYWILVLFIAISGGLLFVNEIASLAALFAGYIIYFYIIDKEVNKKSLAMIILFNIISIFVLYLISS